MLPWFLQRHLSSPPRRKAYLCEFAHSTFCGFASVQPSNFSPQMPPGQIHDARARIDAKNRGGDFDGRLTTIGNVGGDRKMGNLKAYLFGFCASFYLVAAAWFSVGPVMEWASWLGLGALDWVVGLVVFLGLLHLAVEVTSSLRRN